MESGWHDTHRFTDIKEKHSHIARIARSYLVDADMILNKFHEFQPIYNRHSEALHILMPDIVKYASGKKRYNGLLDLGQSIDHILGDNLSHMFIESQNGELSSLVSEAIGRKASNYETHIGFEKIMEQRTYDAHPNLHYRMLLSIKKSRKRVRKLGRLFADYFREHGIDISPRNFACGIMFALGMAERRMLTRNYANHFSVYQSEKKSPAGADMLISRIIMSTPLLAYLIGRNFDDSDRSNRIVAPKDCGMYRRFDEFIGDTKDIYDPYFKPDVVGFWKNKP